ncbi:hypothetical protein RJT34_13867 [Clitoria ternatea]|uniref:Uncharacterized protein n=1 Tax=Clitoria ternatea TaxID=43366 RepID=A0AAN9JPC6_CLITE
MMMMKNQNNQVTSLTTTRLSPLAKPFTLQRSSFQPTSSSLFEQHPSPELPKEGDFDGPHFDVVEHFSFPSYSPRVTTTGSAHVDSHESLLGKGNDDDSSVAHTSMFHKGKHTVHGLNPSLIESDGVFKTCTSSVVGEGEDVLSNSKCTMHTAVECSSIPISNCKVAPLKLSTTDMSSAKKTPQDQSTKNLGESDSDVDSPCWKGTMAFCQTPVEIPGSILVQNVEKTIEKHNSLNPLAPQFFPGIGYVKDDSGSSNSCAPVTTDLLSGEDMLMKTVLAESSVELNKGIELQHSSSTYGREKAFNMLNDPKSSSVDPVLNLPCRLIQLSKEDFLKSKGKVESVVDVDQFVKGTKYSRINGSMSEIFPAKGHSPNPTLSTSSSQVSVVTDLLKTFEGFSKSLIESSKPDVRILVSTMHVLSELLVQTGTDGVDSCNEHGYDEIMIQQIISNLGDFSTKKCDQKIPALDSNPADGAFCHDRSLELTKGLEMTSIETLNVPHQLCPQNDYSGKNKVFKMFGHSGQSFLASSSDNDHCKGNEIAQVIRRSLGKTSDIDRQMNPEAFLFRNLWLDSEADRCYRKYKTYHCLMEAGVDVNCTNVADLLR